MQDPQRCELTHKFKSINGKNVHNRSSPIMATKSFRFPTLTIGNYFFSCCCSCRSTRSARRRYSSRRSIIWLIVPSNVEKCYVFRKNYVIRKKLLEIITLLLFKSTVKVHDLSFQFKIFISKFFFLTFKLMLMLLKLLLTMLKEKELLFLFFDTTF